MSEKEPQPSKEKQRGVPLSEPLQTETSTGPVDSHLEGGAGTQETQVEFPQPRHIRRMRNGPIEIDPRPHEGGI